MIVLLYTPRVGSASRLYFDAQTWQLVRSVGKMNVPDAGGEIPQPTDPSDYRDVDGVKLPYTLVMSNPAQSVTIRIPEGRAQQATGRIR